MKRSALFAAASFALAAVVGIDSTAFAQATSAVASAPLPADPWPRQVNLATGTVLMYQPQVEKWEGNQISFRSALAIQPKGTKQESFGVMFATARTQVDKVARTVVFENLQITKSDFPALPNRGADFAAALQAAVASDVRTISLDRLSASLALNGVKPPTVAVQNDPPKVVVSYSPAVLVPIDGAPVFRAVPSDSRFQRVINTHALILQGGLGSKLYLHVYDGWLTADSVEGPWTRASFKPLGMDSLAQTLAKTGVVDLLAGAPNANPKPSLANGVPTIVTSQAPTELIVFNGQPDFVPINGTQLLWASNTTGDVFVNTVSSAYFILVSGRWFTSPKLDGPWTFVASDALPADFARIPSGSLASVVLPTVAGTPQAQEAVIENSIPQTATVKRVNGPKFTPSFDGPPKYSQVSGTSLSYVVNSDVPLIQVSGASYFAVQAGVWFMAPSVTGPWAIATSVPDVIYTIPPSSPLYYVTYVRIYEATPQVIYVGYTPGYMGTVVSPYGTVIYGTGYAYNPWVGSIWYPPPYTYGYAAAPIYNPYVGFSYGFAVGLATAAWATPYWGWGGAYYHPGYLGGYGCCASASANVYGHWGSTAYSGTRSWYAGGGVAGTTASGTYANARTGTTGSYAAGKQYNAYTGNATRGYDRTANTAAGGSGNVARAGNYNTYTGQRSTASSGSYTGAGGSSIDHSSAATTGPQGTGRTGQTTTYNAKTGETNSWSNAQPGNNNHYADSSGNVTRSDGSGGWQQHSSSGGWSGASGDSSWADRESQARSTGDDRFGGFSDASRSGGFGGGSFGGGGFSGGGFGGRMGGGRR